MRYHEGRERGADQTGKSGMSLDVKWGPDSLTGVRQHGGSSGQMERHARSLGGRRLRTARFSAWLRLRALEQDEQWGYEMSGGRKVTILLSPESDGEQFKVLGKGLIDQIDV